jgi:acyl-CoA synthetase (AMP-forming)/AMP-acid ligase II
MDACDASTPDLPFTGGSLVELLEYRAATQPADLAYVFLRDGEVESEWRSWGDLRRASLDVAHELGRFARPGERVLLLYPPGLEFIEAFFGCLAAGAIAVPVPPPRGKDDEAAAARLASILADAGPVVLLGAGHHLSSPAEIAGRFMTGPESCAGDAKAEPGGRAIIEADQLAFLQYTSGSTASPRGVMVGHANLLHNLAACWRQASDHSPRASVSWLPVTHDMGLIEGILQPAFRGHTAYLMSPAAFLQRPERWLQAISRYRAARSGGPNFAYDLCVRRVTPEVRRTLDLSGWRDAYSGAEPVRADTLAAFAELFEECGFDASAFRPCYGLAESTLLVTAGRWRGDRRNPVTCGTPIDGTSVAIVDPDTRRRLPDGETGEIWVRGPSVAFGYWNRPSDTALVFRASTADGDGPYLRTGDLGAWRHGELAVTARMKDVLIVRGAKHFPQDLEHSAERAHPAIRRGAVAAVALGSCAEGDRVGLVAEIHVDQAGGPLADGIMDAVRSHVCDRHGIRPHAIALCAPGTLPKTTSGKLQRYRCRNRWLEGALPMLAHWEMHAPA